MNEQLSEVMQGLLLEDYQSGQTGSLMTRRMVGAHPEVNAGAVALQIVRRNAEMDGILEANDWGSIEAKGQEIVRLYKARNGADKVEIRPGMSEQEMLEASMQFEPVMVDPNEIAEFRQRLAQLDAQLRPLGTSVWTDPRTARIANILQTSAEPGRPGYLADSEQNLNDQLDPFTAYVGLPVLEGVDAFVEGAAQVGIGARSLLHDMGLVSLDGLSNGNADTLYQGPTSWVQDADGNWYHNGGKVGAAEVYAGIWHSLTGELIDQEMADYADAKARMAMQSSGVQGLSVGLGQFMGSMAAFMGTGGPAMKAGAWLTKGLGIAVTGGKAAKSLSRTEKLVRILAERSGAAAALGVTEAVKTGRIEGYGKALLHGTVMAVPMMVMGAAGDRLERTLRRNKSLPGFLASGLAGTVEGLGLDLGTWEAGWQFVKDPTDETFGNLAQQVLVNSIGNGLLRGSGITGAPGVHEWSMPPDTQRQRKQERRQRAASGDPAEVATERNAQPETVEKLGRATAEMQASVGVNPEAAMAAKRDVVAAEERLNVEEAGLAKTESEKLQARYATREELDRLKEAPNTPEKRQEIIKLLNQSRMAFGKDFAGFVKKTAETMERTAIEDKKAADEILAASDTVKALLGDRAAGDFRAERAKRLAEQGIEMTDLAVEEGKGLRAKEGGEDAELEAMAKKLGMTVEQLRAEMGDDAPPARASIETVPGAEPGPLKPIASKARITPLEEMVQEGGKTGLEPDPTLPPKGPAAPRPVTPEEALTEGLDPETGEPMRAELRAPDPKRPGQPASLRMTPDLEQEGVPGTKSLRASDIFLSLEGFDGDPFITTFRKGVGIRGKLSTKGILGWHHTREDINRLANSRDVAAGFHEWSHDMDLEVGGSKDLFSAKKSPLTPDELKGLIQVAHPWYPGFDQLPRRSQEMEAWAEFWARHMLDDPTLKADAGKFHDWAMKWLADPKREAVRKVIDRHAELYRRYRDQGAIARGEKAIVFFDDKQSLQELMSEGIMKDTTPAKAAGAVRKIGQVLHKTIYDDLADLKRSQERFMVNEYGKEKADEIRLDGSILHDPARLMDVWRMTATRQAERFLVTGTHDLAGNVTGDPLIAVVERAGGAKLYRSFANWLAAKRRIEARGKGLVQGPTSMTDDLYIVEKLERDVFKDGAKGIRAYSDRLIDYGEEAGLFSAEQAKKIKTSFEFYIPFERVLNGPMMAGPGRGVAERGTGVKSMKGSSEEIRDPLNALADMTRTIIAKSQQAMVMKAAVLHGIVHDGQGGFVTEVKRGVIPKDHPMAQVAEAIRRATAGSTADVAKTVEDATEALEKLAEAGEIGSAITLFGQQVMPKGSRAIVAYTPHFSDADLNLLSKKQRKIAEEKNHKLLWLELDVPAYESLMGLDVPPNLMDKLPPLVSGLARGAAYLDRLGSTILNPVFLATNPIRDMAVWALTTRSKTLPGPMSLFSAMGAYAAGLRAVVKGTPSAKKYENLGAGVGTYFGQEFSRGRTAQELLGVHRGFVSSVRAFAGHVGDMFSKPELALRSREFKDRYEKEIAKGRTDLEASLAALEAGQNMIANFTRGGVLTRTMNSVIPYTMAKTSSAMRMAEVLSGRAGKDLQRQAIMRGITAITVPSIALWWLNRDEKWYQELPERERLNFWHFKLPFMDEPIKLAKPFEWGKWFGNIPEVMLEQAFDEDPRSVIDVVFDATTAMIPSNFMPSIAQPIFEWKSNFDTFRERQVVPEWLERNRLPKDQYTAYTRWYAHAITAALGFGGLDVSPIRIERAIDSATGGLVGRSNDLFTDLWALRKLVNSEDFKASDVPVLGRVLVRAHPFSQSRSVQKIFDLDKELQQRSGSGVLTSREKGASKLVNRAKEQITALKKAAREGTIDQAEADQRAADIARQTLTRIDR